MVQERSIPPEKRLLNLIEGNNENAVHAHAQKIRHQGLTLVSPGAWIGRLFFLRDNFKKWFGSGSNQLNIRALNIILLILICVLVIYFAANMFSSIVNITGMANLRLSEKVGNGAQLTGQMPGIGKGAEYYLGKISQRDIFKMVPEHTVAGESKSSEAVSKAAEAASRFKLVGISWSKNPDAMIEDTQALRTFFVKIGQMMGSSAKVQAILKDRVILLYNGEEVELR